MNHSIIVENNLTSFLREFAETERFYTSLNLSYSFVLSKNADWPNFINNIKFSGSDSSLLFQYLSDKINDHNIPPFCLLGPASEPEDIAEIFNEGPFRLIDIWPGMHLDTSSTNLVLNEIDGFSVVTISNEHLLDKWIEIIQIELFPGKRLNLKPFIKLLTNKQFKLYLGLLDGIPVGTSLSFNDAASLGLYMISTKSAYRKKGIGYNMTVYPIIEYLKQNMKCPVVLQATEFGRHVYEKIGFIEICNFYILSYYQDFNKPSI
jgi:hypothetical protein